MILPCYLPTSYSWKITLLHRNNGILVKEKNILLISMSKPRKYFSFYIEKRDNGICTIQKMRNTIFSGIT